MGTHASAQQATRASLVQQASPTPLLLQRRAPTAHKGTEHATGATLEAAAASADMPCRIMPETSLPQKQSDRHGRLAGCAESYQGALPWHSAQSWLDAASAQTAAGAAAYVPIHVWVPADNTASPGAAAVTRTISAAAKPDQHFHACMQLPTRGLQVLGRFACVQLSVNKRFMCAGPPAEDWHHQSCSCQEDHHW